MRIPHRDDPATAVSRRLYDDDHPPVQEAQGEEAILAPAVRANGKVGPAKTSPAIAISSPRLSSVAWRFAGSKVIFTQISVTTKIIAEQCYCDNEDEAGAASAQIL
jgi:hypothetical protein